MSADNHLSPEIDILDQLNGGPVALAVAFLIFADIERAKRALRFMAAEKTVEFVSTGDGNESVLETWQVRQLLDSLTGTPADQSEVRLRLTDLGAHKWLQDSAGFFDQLFSR